MKLAEYLKKEQLSFAAFGERIGKTKQAVSLYCTDGENHTNPNLETAATIEKITNGEVTIADLMTEEQRDRLNQISKI